ncbi:MAG: hypothetical protein IKE81_09015, partial [Clostridia bacterium]|nr:hypothetical protein [Clostridia bacterium]
MNMFIDAIKQEQKRILRVADLTAASLQNAPTGNLSLEQRGNSFYCYAQDYSNGNQQRRYLGVPTSAAAQRVLDARFQRERLKRLEHDRELLSSLEKS